MRGIFPFGSTCLDKPDSAWPTSEVPSRDATGAEVRAAYGNYFPQVPVSYMDARRRRPLQRPLAARST